MFAKLIISGDLVVESGLHIGAMPDPLTPTLADAPVLRDPRSGHPYVPGSSLKGKLRTLLARALQNKLLTNPPGRDPETVCRLFGAPGRRGRLLVRDAAIVEESIPAYGGVLEVKGEGFVDRADGTLKARTLERIIPKTAFRLHFIYDVETAEEVGEDLQNLAGALELLAMDYLGGHGTRGCGRISYRGMSVVQARGDLLDDGDLAILNEVFADAALNL